MCRSIEWIILRMVKVGARIEGTLGQDSPLQHEMRQAIKELGEAARAVRILTDYMERHPEALIYGKGKAK